MARRRAFGTSLAIAVALHALGLALLPRAERPLPATPPPSHASEPAELEIELEHSAAGQHAGPALPSAHAAAAEPGPRLALLVHPDRRGNTATPATPALPSEPPPPSATGTAPGPAPTAPPGHASPAQLGIGFDNPLLQRGSGFMHAPAKRRNAAPGIARSMAQAQADHDAKLGLGPEAPVVAALEGATRALPGPMNGHALFAVRVDAKGKVTALGVLEVSERYSAWKAIAERAAASLARRKPRAPSGGRPVRLVVKVVARNELPSGADPGFAIDLAGIPLKKGEGKHSTRLSILPIVPKPTTVQVPTPDGSYKLPMVTNPIPGLAFAGDPADIAATPHRVVHAHVVSTTVL